MSALSGRDRFKRCGFSISHDLATIELFTQSTFFIYDVRFGVNMICYVLIISYSDAMMVIYRAGGLRNLQNTLMKVKRLLDVIGFMFES